MISSWATFWGWILGTSLVLFAVISVVVTIGGFRDIRELLAGFELARQWGFVDEGHINPCRDIKLFKEKKRDRWVRRDTALAS